MKLIPWLRFGWLVRRRLRVDREFRAYWFSLKKKAGPVR